MAKVISLWHKLIDQVFEETISSLTKEFSMLNERDPNYAAMAEQIKNKYENQFYAFRKRILDLGYAKQNFCECEICKVGASNAVPTVSK